MTYCKHVHGTSHDCSDDFSVLERLFAIGRLFLAVVI